MKKIIILILSILAILFILGCQQDPEGLIPTKNSLVGKASYTSSQITAELLSQGLELDKNWNTFVWTDEIENLVPVSEAIESIGDDYYYMYDYSEGKFYFNPNGQYAQYNNHEYYKTRLISELKPNTQYGIYMSKVGVLKYSTSNELISPNYHEFDLNCDNLVNIEDINVLGDLWRSGAVIDINLVTEKGAECKPLGEYLGNLWKQGITEIPIDDVTRPLSKIKENAKTWEPSYNKISLLNETNKKIILGLKAEDQDINPLISNSLGKGKSLDIGVDLPESFDWRDQHGTDYITSIKDQSTCGSCWAFAGSAVLEGAINAYYNNPDLDYNLSEQDLVSCYHGSGCYGATSAQIENMFKYYFVNDGLCDENCFKYTATDNDCNNRCLNWQDSAWKIASYEGLDYRDIGIEAIKQMLVENGPVEVGMAVYKDFMYYGSGVYYPTTDLLAGYHAVTIVGYDEYDGAGYWIVKNSWGKRWGEDGYFRIYFGASGIDSWFAYSVNEPVTVSGVPPSRMCSDKDDDGYCNWGIGDMPDTCSEDCPMIMDCDDSDSEIYENCGETDEVLGKLIINSNVNGADVYVADISDPSSYIYRGKTPLEIDLGIGNRAIKLSNDGYHDKITQVLISEGVVETIDINLEWDTDYKEGWNYIEVCPDSLRGFDNFVLLEIPDKSKILLAEEYIDLSMPYLDRHICALDHNGEVLSDIYSKAWDNFRTSGSSRPIIDDINHDSQEEHVFSTGKRLIAIDENANIIAGWNPTQLNNQNEPPFIKEEFKVLDLNGLGLLVSDVFDDTNKEIIGITAGFDEELKFTGHSLAVFNNHGELLKEHYLERYLLYYSNIVARKLNDGEGQIIMMTDFGSNLTIFNYSGVVKSKPISNKAKIPLIAGMINIDDESNIVIAEHFYFKNPSTGQYTMRYDITLYNTNLEMINSKTIYDSLGKIYYTPLAIADIYDNDQLKIIAVTPSHVIILNSQLELETSIDLGGVFNNKRIVVADIDNDNIQDIVLLSENKVSVYKLTSSGHSLIFEKDSPYKLNFVEVNDIDNDQKPDIIVSTNEKIAIFKLGSLTFDFESAEWFTILKNNQRNAVIKIGTQAEITCDPGQKIGDVDGDEDVDFTDQNLTAAIVVGNIPSPEDICCVDIDQDDIIDLGDVVKVGRIAAGLDSSPGVCGQQFHEYDFNCDSEVNMDDVNVLSNLWRSGTVIDQSLVTEKQAECKPLGDYLASLLEQGLTELPIDDLTRIASEIQNMN